MLPMSRTVQTLVTAALLCLVCEAVGQGRPVRKPDPRHMAERGLAGFLKAQWPDKPPPVLVAEAPCGEGACIHLGLDSVSRDLLMRSLPQLAGGFGTGADVLELEFSSRGRSIAAASLRLLVRSGVKSAPEQLGERAGRLLDFLKTLSALAPAEPVAFSPRTTPPDKAVYFIQSVKWERSGRDLEAFLLSPPETPFPVPSAPTSDCIEGRTSEAGVSEAAPFAGWKKFRVSWTWVCNGEGKALQSDERATGNR